MDLKVQRLSQGEKIAAGSALTLFVCMFLGWFNFGFGVANAWDSLHYISPILAIVIAATLTITFLKANGRDVLDLPHGTVIFALGCLAAVLVLFRLIDPISAGDASPFGGGGSGLEDGGSPEAGLFLGLLAAAGIAAGGYLSTGGQALDQVKALFASGGPVAPQQSPPLPPVEAPLPGAAPTTAAPQSPAPPAPPTQPPAPPPTPPQPASVEPEAVEGGLVFCEHCRARIRESDRFCGECGQPAASQ